MPGSQRLTGSYLTLLREIHEHTHPDTYVEIGVHEGVSLRRTEPGTRIIAVDPEPHLPADLASTLNLELHAETSDEFFSLERPTFDLAFIDGLHHFEQALRDFRNLEALSGPRSVILIHDIWPQSPAWATRQWSRREWSGKDWTGDVWKLVPALAKWRPDLTVTVAAAGPSGLAIVSSLEASNRVLFDEYEQIVSERIEDEYVTYETSVGVPPVFPDWSGVGHVWARSRSERAALLAVSVRRRLGRGARKVRRRLEEIRSPAEPN